MATSVSATYVVPIRRDDPEGIAEFAAYLRSLAGRVEVVVVDGSPCEVFKAHAEAFGMEIVHVVPDPDLVTPMGKVGGVLTGVRRAGHEKVVIADDDIRYDPAALARVVLALDRAHVVRPQNYFDPLPWHARWDTGRSLLNRLTGGDWPGTLGVRRSALQATGGYDGNVMFENLELVRTVRAAGGVEAVPLDLFVRRLPPSARHFWSQRTRQAYDEFARPLRMAAFLAVLPLAGILAFGGRWKALLAFYAALVGLAEAGRRRGGGRGVFPPMASLLAPAWVAERAVCSWLVVGARLFKGGIPYRGVVLRRAASPVRELRRRHGQRRLAPPVAPVLDKGRARVRSRTRGAF